jgi:hypothetical protein
MSVSVMIAQELLGLFELDETGKVLYYRMDSDGMQGGTSPDIAGHNFYDEIAPFDNVEEFRRCVTEFTRGAKATDTFEFDCRYEDSAHPVRVLLARICERMNRNKTKSVLVHIRPRVTPTRTPRNFRGDGDERNVNQ